MFLALIIVRTFTNAFLILDVDLFPVLDVSLHSAVIEKTLFKDPLSLFIPAGFLVEDVNVTLSFLFVL